MGFWRSVKKAVKSCFKAVGKAVVSAAKAVGSFIEKHGKKLLAGAAIIAGIALCFVPGGVAIGAGLICGGLNAGMLSFNKNASWKDFGKAFLGGFAAGCITTLAAPAIAAMAATAGGIATSTFAATAISCTVSAAAYAGIGVFTNGINNKIFGKKFFDNFKTAAICGGLIGFISPVINSSGINEAVVKFFKPLESKLGISLTTGMMASVGGKGLRMAANFCISAVTQKIQTGRISLRRAVVDSVVYGYVNHRMAAQAIETGVPQFCTVDQPVPYTYLSQDVRVVNAPTPPSTSQSQTNPSNPSNRIEPINSTGTDSMPVAAREPLIAERSAVNEGNAYRNVQANIRPIIRDLEATILPAQKDTVIEAPRNANIEKTDALTFVNPVSTNSLSAKTIDSDPANDNKILQALKILKPVNYQLLASQANTNPEIQPLMNVHHVISDKTKPTASTTNVASQNISQNDIVSLPEKDNIPLQSNKNDVRFESTITDNMLTKGAPSTASTSMYINESEKNEVKISKELKQHNQNHASNNFIASNHAAAEQSINSLFVSNIFEELKFIENEQNRREENVNNYPSKVYVFQNAMDNENVRVGVQIVATKTSKSNVNANPTSQTINVETNRKEMGYGQKLCNEKLLLASEQPSTLTSNLRGLNSNQHFQPVNPIVESPGEAPKVVVTYPIISFLENEYKILHWEEWPKLSKDVKIVNVSGPHASGRTTFIHSLIYFWGYKLLKDQIIISKLRIGVVMYHIPDKNIIILDCCDSMDASNPDEITASSLILETFCHLISDHRIHHITIDEKTFSSPQKYFDHCEQRMKTLYGCGVKAIPSGGGLQSTLLMRYYYLSENQMKGFDEWHENWQKDKMNVKEKITCLSTADENGLTEEQKKEAMDLCEKGFFNYDVEILKFLPEDYSMNDLETNQTQIKTIAKLIEEKTKPLSIEDNSKDEDIRKLLCQTWYSVVTNEELKTDFSNVVNQVASAVEGNDYDIQGFINKLIKYAENYKNEAFVKEFGEFVEKIGKRLEASKDKADPMIAFELISGSSSIFFAEGLRVNDLKVQNDLIEMALEGFTFFLRNIKNSQNFELLSIRMAINDHKIFEKYLSAPIVFQNFDRCWLFLKYSAIYGYRLELIQYDIFAKIIQVCNKQSYSLEGERIAIWAFSTLQALLTLDTSKVFGEDPPPSEADKFQLSQQQFVKAFGIYEKFIEKKMEPLRTTRNMTIQEVQKRYNEILKYPKEFFDATDIAKMNEKSFEDLDPRQAHFFTILLFRQLYKAMAFYFADHVIENQHIFMSRESDPVEIITAKIKVWQRVLSLCEESEVLYKSVLAKTNIKKWVLEMLKQPNSRYFIDTIELSNSILAGDYHSDIRDKLAEEISSKEVKRDKINTLDDIRRQELRKELLEHYGDFCLDLIESEHIQRIINIFLDQHFELPYKATVFVLHIERLLHYGKYEDDRALCLDIFIKKRLQIIAKLDELFKRLLKANEIEIQKSKHFMTVSALLISELIYYFFANDKQKFYQSYREPEKVLYECESWNIVMLIIGITVRDILQRQKNSQHLEDDDDDDNIFRPRIVLSFMYNVAMTSEITNSEIIANTTGHNRVAGLQDTDEGSWDRMILSQEKFIKIKKDDVNIRRCAYIYAKYVLPKIIDSKKTVNLNLKESFAAELSYFKQMFRKHVDEVSAEVEEKETIEGWIHAEEARQKHLGKLENRITGSNELTFGNVVQASSNPSTSLQLSTEFAVEDVFVFCTGHSFLDGIKVPYTNHKIKMYKILKEKYGNGSAIGLMICIDRNCKNESVKKFLTLIRKIADNVGNDHHELKVQNKNIQLILQLQYALDALEAFGYHKVMREKEEWLIADPKNIAEKSKYAKTCLEFVDTINENAVFEWHFDHTFQLVNNGIPMSECRLPTIFFNKNNDINSSTALPIRILEEKRRFYSFANFSLVRIKLQDGRIFQAVFHKSATISDVGAEVDSLFLNELHTDPIYCICDESGQEIEDISKKYKNLTSYLSGTYQDITSPDFNVLDFWLGRRKSQLFKIAMKVLSIPATSCSPERGFSVVKRLVTNERSSMNTETVTKIMIGKSLKELADG